MRTRIFFLVCLLTAIPCRGEIIIVDDDLPADFNNIQAAINDSNDGDIIYVFPGTYTGPGNHDIDFFGKAITVRSVVPEDPYIVAATIIDCNDGDRGFYFHNEEGPNSVVDGLTVTGNWCGIRCSGSSPVIRNCVIKDCSYGGIRLYQSNVTISGCTITGNGSPGGEDGGGIYFEGYGGGSVTVSDCVISYNSSQIGGGISCSFDEMVSDMKVSGCTFIGNSAERDAGAISGCTGPITNCIFIANVAEDDGGALSYCWGPITNCIFIDNTASNYPYYYGHGGALYSCWVPVTNCVFTNNRAGGKGGAICWGYPGINAQAYEYYVNPKISNCTFTANSAVDEGGAIYVGMASLTVANCTFSSNQAGYFGGGIYYDAGALTVTNCILWGNTDSTGTGELAQIGGQAPDVTFSCIQDDDPNDSYVPFSDEDGNNIDDNPIFVHDPNDGGDGWGDDPCTPDVNEGANDDFGDLHLQSGSPCINAGDPNFWASWKVDMDGQPRVMGYIIDMGADEFLIPWLTVTMPEGGEVWVAGSWHEITWESYGVNGRVAIFYSSNNGSSWTTVENNVANTGEYTWHLPAAVDSNQCLVWIVPRGPDPNVVLVGSGLFTIHPDSPGPAVASKWKSLGGDFDRAGLSENYGPELGCVKWTFETDAAVSASVTIGVDDRVAIACEDGKLYTLDANGMLLWSYDTNSPLISAPSIGADGTVYVGSETGKLYAIDIDGDLRWTHTADGFIYSSPAVSADGNNIYVGSKEGVLYALARDGSELWTFELYGSGVIGGSIFASPAVGADGTIYVGGLYDANLYALEPNDGSVKWACNFEYQMFPNSQMSYTKWSWPFASPVIAADGTIYQTLLYDPNLYAIKPNEPNAGTIIWSTNLADSDSGWFDSGYISRHGDVDGWSEPALGPDGTIYVSLNDPYLRAVEPDGSIKWVTRLGMMDGFTLTVGSDGLVYAAGNDGYLCVVDANGYELARFASDSGVKLPVISADNTIIISDANRVWAIDGCSDAEFVLHRPEDVDASRIVDFVDFALLALDWLACNDMYPPCEALVWDGTYFTGDIDRNLYVDFVDVAAIANRWLSTD